jgi:hypothetical protein
LSRISNARSAASRWALVFNALMSWSRPPTSSSVSLASCAAGVIEAADLVQSGIVTRAAVFTYPPTLEEHEFIRGGLPYESASATQTRRLNWLGVTEVMQIPGAEIGTEGEGQVLPSRSDQHQFSLHCVRSR